MYIVEPYVQTACTKNKPTRAWTEMLQIRVISTWLAVTFAEAVGGVAEGCWETGSTTSGILIGGGCWLPA